MQPGVKTVNEMTPAEESAFWTAFETDLMQGDSSAAQEHLAAGFPIYFRDADTPDDLVIKRHPDGRRELVLFDEAGETVVQSAA